MPRPDPCLLAGWLALAACGGPDPAAETPPELLSEPALDYPPDLYVNGVSGTVQLRLFVDSTGAVVAESARIVRSGGHAAFDSAALATVPTLRYSPATRRGQPVATAFLQDIRFAHPGADSIQ